MSYIPNFILVNTPKPSFHESSEESIRNVVKPKLIDLHRKHLIKLRDKPLSEFNGRALTPVSDYSGKALATSYGHVNEWVVMAALDYHEIPYKDERFLKKMGIKGIDIVAEHEEISVCNIKTSTNDCNSSSYSVYSPNFNKAITGLETLFPAEKERVCYELISKTNKKLRSTQILIGNFLVQVTYDDTLIEIDDLIEEMIEETRPSSDLLDLIATKQKEFEEYKRDHRRTSK